MLGRSMLRLGALLFIATALSGPLAAYPGQVRKLRVDSLYCMVTKVVFPPGPTTGKSSAENIYGFKFAFNRDNRKHTFPEKDQNKFIIASRGRPDDRFLLRKIEQRRSKDQKPYRVAIIEDRQENKAGTIYEVPQGNEGLLIHDWGAVLRLGGKTTKVRINDSFKMPLGKEEGDLHSFKGLNKAGDLVISYLIDDKPKELTLRPPARRKVKKEN